MDEQKKLLQGLWRKAFLHHEELRVPCKTKANATKLRFSLYNAVRKVRTGKEPADKELLQAVENCTIGFAPDDETVVLIQKKVMTDLMQAIIGIVGDDPNLLKSEEDIEIANSQESFLKKLNDPSQGLTERDLGLPRSTPYYTRKGNGNEPL